MSSNCKIQNQNLQQLTTRDLNERDFLICMLFLLNSIVHVIYYFTMLLLFTMFIIILWFLNPIYMQMICTWPAIY